MTLLTYNDDSFKRALVSLDEVKEALDDPLVLEVEEGESASGNPTVIYVGKTQTERLLEIGVEYKEFETHIYHARKANAKFRKLYEQHWQQQELI
jgi:uncharacterized DUF497 family protein